MSKKAVAEKHFFAELNLTDYINKIGRASCRERV